MFWKIAKWNKGKQFGRGNRYNSIFIRVEHTFFFSLHSSWLQSHIHFHSGSFWITQWPVDNPKAGCFGAIIERNETRIKCVKEGLIFREILAKFLQWGFVVQISDADSAEMGFVKDICLMSMRDLFPTKWLWESPAVMTVGVDFIIKIVIQTTCMRSHSEVFFVYFCFERFNVVDYWFRSHLDYFFMRYIMNIKFTVLPWRGILLSCFDVDIWSMEKLKYLLTCQ